MIHINTVIYRLVVQITLKLCIHLQDKSSSEIIFVELSCFEYQVKRTPLKRMLIVQPTRKKKRD